MPFQGFSFFVSAVNPCINNRQTHKDTAALGESESFETLHGRQHVASSSLNPVVHSDFNNSNNNKKTLSH